MVGVKSGAGGEFDRCSGRWEGVLERERGVRGCSLDTSWICGWERISIHLFEGTCVQRKKFQFLPDSLVKCPLCQ